MRIAVDAMGGDYAPQEIIKGAVQAVREEIADVILVGKKDVVEAELARYPEGGRVAVYHASEVIGMDEQPANALRRKKDASITIATRLVKEGEAMGLVSAGSTGAQMTAALLGLGRIHNVQRPAIATVLPTLKGGKLLLDVGANVDCKPGNLVEFAHMGSIYASTVLGIANPRVGLLNIGTEATKGNELTLAAYKQLLDCRLNFVGNIEARDIPLGNVDVIVCDGFVGNSLLKFGEGLISSLFGMFQAELGQSVRTRLGAALILPSLKNIKRQLEYEEYGGAPLLGVQGVSIICHGSSKARAIKNAIKMAVRCVENQFVDHLTQTYHEESGT